MIVDLKIDRTPAWYSTLAGWLIRRKNRARERCLLSRLQQGSGNEFEAGAPQRLFPVDTNGIISSRRLFSVTADEQRLLVNVMPDQTPPGHIVLMQNWFRPGVKP